VKEMNLKQFKWILGGSYNIFSVIHCYAIDYLKYPQSFKAKIQEIWMLLRGEYKWWQYACS